MPSAKILEKKKQVVEALTSELKDVQSMVFTDYLGLTVDEDTGMRADFRKEGLEYRVVKNTVTERVFDNLELGELKSILNGSTAVAYSNDDPILAPRLVAKYQKKFKKTKIKGGVIEGKIVSLETIKEIAELQSMTNLYGRLVSTMMSPLSGLAVTLNLIAQKGEEQGVEKVSDLLVKETAAAETKSEEQAAESVEVKAEEPVEEKTEKTAE